ncbi:sigma-54 dependent transcriptional regulator [Proteiniphilum sp.]|uniref:sigma-54-dependent transcriptional regulator n=1 Tax=Proteiniphilum sp. TaxID=1926877 RepID=UPI002B1EDEF4|nr:sigma-54 dependent transcriptional regulator [Proteiniphilum sp.]MEA4919015.1 sigma-54 dependent transcriptional regulator [Proteiniphilum sp.]
MANRRILIVEDDRSFGPMLQKWFERNGFSATLCSGMVAAQEALSQTDPYQVVLSDLRLPDGDGIMLLNWLNETHRSIPIIIMTGYGEIQTAVSAIKLGAFDFLEKPINPEILKKKIEAAFDARQENISLPEKQPVEKKSNREHKEFVEGQSTPSYEMYTYIDLVAPTQMAVMIIGESGTGKEHVARLIHNRSNRAGGPFIAVDCGSLSIELAPSELFGHKKGSFTSAIEDKTGFFREAHGGTLFLDEVGNLPYGVQMQLLRTLQEKKVRPVGTSTDQRVDVRIITATNENLEKAIDKGNFREDLYHRLNEFMIKVPSLRDCAEDIPAYADHFREEANRELGREVDAISPEAIAVLKGYTWPGNLRELRNVIRRAVLFSKGDAIIPDSLPILTAKKEELQPKVDVSLSVEPEEEKEKILRALAQAKGNKTKAAILLQIDRKTLYNKLHQYSIGL